MTWATPLIRSGSPGQQGRSQRICTVKTEVEVEARGLCSLKPKLKVPASSTVSDGTPRLELSRRLRAGVRLRGDLEQVEHLMTQDAPRLVQVINDREVISPGNLA